MQAQCMFSPPIRNYPRDRMQRVKRAETELGAVVAVFNSLSAGLESRDGGAMSARCY